MQKINNHIKSDSIEYSSWKHMVNRCKNMKDEHYPDYGGRGIVICERWLIFENFYSDMGSRPSLNHSIDRINNDGNYEPHNCRWATKSEQARNKRLSRINKSGRQGVHWHIRKQMWQADIKVNTKRIHLGTFKTFDEAVQSRNKAEIIYWNKQPNVAFY